MLETQNRPTYLETDWNTIAGRRLDVAVATVVIGWTDVDHALDTSFAAGHPPDHQVGDDKRDVPSYSADPTSAFAVVTRMREQGWELMLSGYLHETGRRGSVAEFYVDSGEEEFYGPKAWAIGKSGVRDALAISRAALMAQFQIDERARAAATSASESEEAGDQP